MAHIDTMQISMTKQHEDDIFVWYKFEFNVETGTYLSKSGNIRYNFEPKYGIIKISKNFFDKEKNSNEKKIEIINEETDSVFLNISEEDKHRIYCMCLGAINQFKKGSEFPDYAGRQIG